MSKDDYNESSMDATISRIETKLDTFIEEQAALKQDVKDLKQFKYYLMGAVAFAAALGDRFIDWVTGAK